LQLKTSQRQKSILRCRKTLLVSGIHYYLHTDPTKVSPCLVNWTLAVQYRTSHVRPRHCTHKKRISYCNKISFSGGTCLSDSAHCEVCGASRVPQGHETTTPNGRLQSRRCNGDRSCIRPAHRHTGTDGSRVSGAHCPIHFVTAACSSGRLY
jgi:hypothetical protein